MPKNLLIVYPHWHPANLAGVHRPRLIGNFLPEFGWHPIVLTVDAKYYEETPDPDFAQTFAPHFEVHRVKALPLQRPRFIGDIGLRAFFTLKKAALRLIRERAVDFLWIPIPSFYMANLGRILHERTGIPYGIDYIDPWIRDISNRSNLRARLSQLAARMLEPHAVKKARLISGVAFKYYQPVLEKHFKKPAAEKEAPPSYSIPHVAMPYGFDPRDHQVQPANVTYPWAKGQRVFLYAGAFLPHSGYFIQQLFRALQNLLQKGSIATENHLYFLGTGPYTHQSIAEYASENQVTNFVTEIRERYPFLHILHFLGQAEGVMVIGSTEAHYTASKIYQALLSGRRVFAVFHAESSAARVMEECQADQYLVRYHESLSTSAFFARLQAKFEAWLENRYLWQPRLQALNRYSARESARKLAGGIERALSDKP